MAGLAIKLYTNYGALFAHPDDPEVCLTFHARGEQCPCEYWEYAEVAFLPVGWFVERVPMLTETGFMLTYHGKYYEVLSLE